MSRGKFDFKDVKMMLGKYIAIFAGCLAGRIIVYYMDKRK